MARISQYPVANGIQCVKADVILPEKYHQKQLDEETYRQGIEDWQFDRPYHQKWQLTDKMYAEIHASFSSDFPIACYYDIYKCGEGKVVSQIDNDFTIYDTNSVAVLPDGTTVPLTVYKWQFRWSDFDLDEGLYYIEFITLFYDGDEVAEVRSWISEPQELAVSHPDTILVEATNDTNKDDIIYVYDTTENTGFIGDAFYKPTNCIRVEGQLIDPNIDSTGTEMNEQDYEVRQTSAYVWRNFFCYIGGDNGVPFYLFEKFNWYLKADQKYIEGRRFEKEQGEKLVRDKTDYYPLYTGGVTVREYYRQDEFTDDRGQKLLIAPATAYPHAVYQAGLVDKVTLKGVVLDNDTEKNTWVTDLNTIWNDTYNLSGTWTNESGNIYYTCGLNETYSALEPLILTNPLIFTISADALEKMAFRFTSGYGVVDWGALYFGLGIIYQHPFGFPVDSVNPITLSYVYGSTATYTVRVFAANDATPLKSILSQSVNYQTWGFTCAITAITGLTHFGLQELNIRGATLGSFNLDILSPARRTIRTANFSTCGITGIDLGVFDDFPWSSNPTNWMMFQNFSVYENGLDATELASVVNKFYEKTPHNMGGNLLLRQTPPVTIVDSTALARITSLRASSFFVLYP